jgi:hypothetical protein
MASQNIVFPGKLQSAGANPSKVSCLYPKLDGAKQSWIGFNQHQAHELPSVHPQVDHGRTAMSVETRMVIEHSTPMPECSGWRECTLRNHGFFALGSESVGGNSSRLRV